VQSVVSNIVNVLSVVSLMTQFLVTENIVLDVMFKSTAFWMQQGK